MVKIFLFLFVLLGSCLAIYAQDDFPYDKYLPRTLAEIGELNVALQNASPAGKDLKMGGLIFDADFLYSHARVKFMNKSRPISADRKELMGLWQKTFSIDEKNMALFENEYLFKECNTEYWIPVQKQVAGYFAKELKEGDMLTLYFLRASGKRAKGSEVWDWIYLVNEFIK